MTKIKLEKQRIYAGAYEGILTGADPQDLPEIELMQSTQFLTDATLTPVDDTSGLFLVRAEIPVDVLSDGVLTFVLSHKGSAEILDSFAIVTGEALSIDLRAEVDLLRTELDVLKRSFRIYVTQNS